MLLGSSRPIRSCRQRSDNLDKQLNPEKAVKETPLDSKTSFRAKLKASAVSNSSSESEQTINSDEPETRWSKDDDIVLYSAFKSLIAQHNLDEEDFYNLRGRMTLKVREVLASLLVQCQWRGHIYSLKTRITKIMKSKNFTAREIRKLKRLLKLEKKGTITMSYVLEQFPGKTLKTIQKYQRKHYAAD